MTFNDIHSNECFGQLVLKHIFDVINDISSKHESAVYQCCNVSLLESSDKYNNVFSPVIYIHTDRLQHRLYRYGV